MNYFNRFIAVLVSLVVIGALVIAIMAMYGMELGFFNGYLSQEIDYLGSLEGWRLVAGTAAAVFLILVFLFIIYFEIRRLPEKENILISSNENGLITMSRESLEKYAKVMGLQIAQVRDIRCNIWQTDKGLKVNCHPILLTGAQVQDQAPEIREQIAQTITNVTGIPVIKISVKARYDSPEKPPREQFL